MYSFISSVEAIKQFLIEEEIVQCSTDVYAMNPNENERLYSSVKGTSTGAVVSNYRKLGNGENKKQGKHTSSKHTIFFVLILPYSVQKLEH